MHPAATASLDDFSATRIDGTPLALSSLHGQVVLIVNTASQCGFTPQFEGLEQLHRRYADQGLTVLGFPCNQFGLQDPGSNGEIAGFCERNYGVSFAMMSKIDVNGESAHPLFQWLTAAAPGVLGTTAVKWNFTKFLIGRSGRVISRFAPTDKPAALTQHIEAALAVTVPGLSG